jgi:hypothetical protein
MYGGDVDVMGMGWDRLNGNYGVGYDVDDSGNGVNGNGFWNKNNKNNKNKINKHQRHKLKPVYEKYKEFQKKNRTHKVLILKVFNASSNLKKHLIFKTSLNKPQEFKFGRTPENEINVNLSDISRKHLR